MANSRPSRAIRPRAPGKPRQPGEHGPGQGGHRKGRLELEMPGDRGGEVGFGDAQHDRHAGIAGARAQCDFEVQGVDIGQRDEAVRRGQIAQIERVVAAGVPGQEIETLVARALDQGGVGGLLDHDDRLVETQAGGR